MGEGWTRCLRPPYISKTRWPPVTVGARSRQSYRRIGYCEQSKRSIDSRSSSVVICIGIRSGTCSVKPCFTDTRLIRTPRYYGQFALSLGKESPYIFSQFNPLNTDTWYGLLSVRINGVWLYWLNRNALRIKRAFLAWKRMRNRTFKWRHGSYIGVPK